MRSFLRLSVDDCETDLIPHPRAYFLLLIFTNSMLYLEQWNTLPSFCIWRNFETLSLVCDVVHPFQSCNCLVTSLARLCEPVSVNTSKMLALLKFGILTRQRQQSHFLRPAFPGLCRWPPQWPPGVITVVITMISSILMIIITISILIVITYLGETWRKDIEEEEEEQHCNVSWNLSRLQSDVFD